jgi:hypothetical protein
MATLKAFSNSDIQTAQSFLTQLIDVVQEDISGSLTRRKYQVFVTGGVGPGVTSSLFQTVYDQDFSLQTSNPMFDMTVGIFSGSSTVAGSSTGIESTGKLLFPSTSLMMREKVDIYHEFAQTLLGDRDRAFFAPFANNDPGTSLSTSTNRMNNVMFLTFKRLFHRDGIKKETFAMKFFQSASRAPLAGHVGDEGPNLNQTSTSGSAIYTDAGSASTLKVSNAGGTVGNIVDSSNTDETVGLMFYDRGVAVFDLEKVLSGAQHVSGVIDAMSSNAHRDAAAGKTIIGDATTGNADAKFIPDFMVSASVDNIVDHLASARFQSGTLTAMTFQNLTNINSTLYFCRANADEFNYSSNPTYLDADGNINVIDAAARQDGSQKSFSFITKVGLHDAQGNLLAVAKLSRPVEKNPEKDITFRVRLDF